MKAISTASHCGAPGRTIITERRVAELGIVVVGHDELVPAPSPVLTESARLCTIRHRRLHIRAPVLRIEATDSVQVGGDHRTTDNDTAHNDNTGKCNQARIARLEDEAHIARLEDEARALRYQVENLELALHNARMIGAAVGIVMASTKSTYDDAFHVLVGASTTGNIKLRDVADRILLTGAV